MTVLHPPFASVCSHFVKTLFCDKKISKNRYFFSMYSLPLVGTNKVTSPCKGPLQSLHGGSYIKGQGIQEFKYRKIYGWETVICVFERPIKVL